MVDRRLVPVLLAAALLPGGCGLLGALPAAPAPSPSVAPLLAATDAPVPYTLRAAVEPARRFLLERRDVIGGAPFALRFVRGYCAVGAQAALVFEQLPAAGSSPSVPPTYAIAYADDIAKGIIAGGWSATYDLPDPATQTELTALFGGREFPCP